MERFGIDEVLRLQRELQDKYKGRLEPICPDIAQNKLLWLLGEAGEVIDILKQNGGEAACEDPDIRAHLVEELADMLMYYGDILLCCGIDAEELADAYRKKQERNLTRW